MRKCQSLIFSATILFCTAVHLFGQESPADRDEALGELPAEAIALKASRAIVALNEVVTANSADQRALKLSRLDLNLATEESAKPLPEKPLSLRRIQDRGLDYVQGLAARHRKFSSAFVQRNNARTTAIRLLRERVRLIRVIDVLNNVRFVGWQI